jgi:hypothetical protein
MPDKCFLHIVLKWNVYMELVGGHMVQVQCLPMHGLTYCVLHDIGSTLKVP